MKLTELLAIYGALLSTFVFFWNVLKSKRRIRVKLMYGIEGEGEDIQSGVYVFIQNPSSSVVHVSGMSVLSPWKNTRLFDIISNSVKHRRVFTTYGWIHSSLSLYGMDDGLPVSIEPGHAHKVLIPDNVVDEVLEEAVSRKIMASVQDQFGNTTCSKAFYAPKLSNDNK